TAVPIGVTRAASRTSTPIGEVHSERYVPHTGGSARQGHARPGGHVRRGAPARAAAQGGHREHVVPGPDRAAQGLTGPAARSRTSPLVLVAASAVAKSMTWLKRYMKMSSPIAPAASW